MVLFSEPLKHEQMGADRLRAICPSAKIHAPVNAREGKAGALTEKCGGLDHPKASVEQDKESLPRIAPRLG